MNAVRRKSHVSGLRSQVSTLRDLTIGIIGAGKMGQALINGLLEHGVARRRLHAADPSLSTRRMVARQCRITVSAHNADAIRGADVVLLAVKPQQMAQVIAQLAPHLRRRRPLVISIAAGITLRWLQARLPGVPIVRVMPNLPATVGCGFSVIAAGRAATTRHRTITAALFRTVGVVRELPEYHLDAITAVSGSGPAYVFFLVRMWEEAARSLGLPSAVASQAIQQTLEGSVRLLRAAGEPPASLIAKVASKGGTTEAALKVLARRRVQSHFIEALRAAARRSKELSVR